MSGPSAIDRRRQHVEPTIKVSIHFYIFLFRSSLSGSVAMSSLSQFSLFLSATVMSESCSCCTQFDIVRFLTSVVYEQQFQVNQRLWRDLLIAHLGPRRLCLIEHSRFPGAGFRWSSWPSGFTRAFIIGVSPRTYNFVLLVRQLFGLSLAYSTKCITVYAFTVSLSTF